MKNYIFLLIFGLLYITVLTYLIIKAKDIFRNPDKYDKVNGGYKYLHSFWYEPPSRYRRRLFSKNYIASVLVWIPLIILLPAAYYFICIAIQKYLFLPNEAILLKSDGVFIGGIGMLFLSIILAGWISFHSSAPIMIACSLTAFHSRNRSGDWKKLICGLLITAGLCLPLMAAGINTYAYLTDDGISVNRFLSIKEENLLFSDVTESKTSFRSSNDQTEFYFSYAIASADGCQIDLFDYCSVSQLSEIHNELQSMGVSMERGIIDRNTFQLMQNTTEEEILELLPHIFVVED